MVKSLVYLRSWSASMIGPTACEPWEVIKVMPSMIEPWKSLRFMVMSFFSIFCLCFAFKKATAPVRMTAYPTCLGSNQKANIEK